jgi:hypothetical protein
MSVSGCGDEDDRGGGNLTVNNCEAGSFIMCLVQMGTKLRGATNFRFACSETFYPLAIWGRFVYPFDITCKKTGAGAAHTAVPNRPLHPCRIISSGSSTVL